MIQYIKATDFVKWLNKTDNQFVLDTNGSGKISWWEELYDPYNQTNNKYNEIWFGVDGLKDTARNYRVGIAIATVV